MDGDVKQRRSRLRARKGEARPWQINPLAAGVAAKLNRWLEATAAPNALQAVSEIEPRCSRLENIVSTPSPLEEKTSPPSGPAIALTSRPSLTNFNLMLFSTQQRMSQDH